MSKQRPQKPRLYFDCLIQALYMQKNFGVNLLFYDGHIYKTISEAEIDGAAISNYKDLIEELQDDWERVCVAPESESIFEPQEGDMDPLGRTFLNINTKTCEIISGKKTESERFAWISIFDKIDLDGKWVSEVENSEIKLRNNIQFFQPKQETK